MGLAGPLEIGVTALLEEFRKGGHIGFERPEMAVQGDGPISRITDRQRHSHLPGVAGDPIGYARMHEVVGAQIGADSTRRGGVELLCIPSRTPVVMMREIAQFLPQGDMKPRMRGQDMVEVGRAGARHPRQNEQGAGLSCRGHGTKEAQR